MKTIEQVQEEVSLEVYRIEYYKLNEEYKLRLSEQVAKAFAKECLTEVKKRIQTSGYIGVNDEPLVGTQCIEDILEEIK